MIFPKGNKLNSIIPIRFPLCHKEKFLKSFVYDLSRFTKVRNQYNCCGLKYLWNLVFILDQSSCLWNWFYPNDTNRNNFLYNKHYLFLSHNLPLNLLRYDPVGYIHQYTFKNNLGKYFFHTKKIIQQRKIKYLIISFIKYH